MDAGRAFALMSGVGDNGGMTMQMPEFDLGAVTAEQRESLVETLRMFQDGPLGSALSPAGRDAILKLLEEAGQPAPAPEHTHRWVTDVEWNVYGEWQRSSDTPDSDFAHLVAAQDVYCRDCDVKASELP